MSAPKMWKIDIRQLGFSTRCSSFVRVRLEIRVLILSFMYFYIDCIQYMLPWKLVYVYEMFQMRIAIDVNYNNDQQEAFRERRHLHICDLWHVIVTFSLSQELLDYLIKCYPVDKYDFDLSLLIFTCLYPSGDIPCQILWIIRSTCF